MASAGHDRDSGPPHPAEATLAWDSFLVGAGALVADPASLELMRVGTCLVLRPAMWHRLGVLSPEGAPLGTLPSDDAQLLADLLGRGAAATASVRAVGPAFRRPRVH